MKRTAILFLVTLATVTYAKADEWSRREETSALNDTRSIFWTLEADMPTADAIGRPEKPTLHIMCFQNETRVVFNFNDYMGSDEFYMQYRVDKATAKAASVTISDSGRIFGFWEGRGIPFLKEIANAKKLAVGVTPYNGSPQETVFTLAGLSKAMAEVRAACKW